MNADINEKAFYTFLLDFEGGTYISQIKANTLREAKKQWSEELYVESIKGMGERMKQLISQEHQDITPLSGLVNAWCFTIIPAGRLGIVHVVRTSEE